MGTTPVALRSRVCAPFAGVLGIPGAFVGAVAGAPSDGEIEKANRDNSSEMRVMPILGLKRFSAGDRTSSSGGWFLSSRRSLPNKVELLGRAHIIQSSHRHCMRRSGQFLRIMAHFLANRGHGIAKPVQVFLGLG